MARFYKDSLFRSLFGNPDAVREIYNAVRGGVLTRPLGPQDRVAVNTLGDTLFTSRKNDLSATINDILFLVTEHQSTLNPNLPFRFLDPVVRLLQNAIADRRAIYQEDVVSLLRPECVALYNGRQPLADYTRLRLSDAFHPVSWAGEGSQASLELVVDVYNINEGHSPEVLGRSPLLSGYAMFVGRARDFTAEAARERPGAPREEAVERGVAAAIEYCERRGILAEYWENLTLEDRKMLTGEWKLEEAMEVWREEQWRRGLAEGLRKGRNAVLDLLRQGVTLEEIERMVAAEGPRPGAG